MNETNQMMLFNAAAVLLPLIPAILLFKYLPSSGEAEGPFKGLRIKFSGAFAAYFVLFLVMWAGIPKDFHHFHYWTVKGSVMLSHPTQEQEPSLREVVCRIVPPKFEVENDGSFAFEIPVPEDSQGQPLYPDLQINLRDYSGATVPLTERHRPGYGAPVIALKFEEKERTIELMSPIVLSSSRFQPQYGEQAPQTPQPRAAVTTNQ